MPADELGRLQAPEAQVVELFERLFGFLARHGRVPVVWDDVQAAFARQHRPLPAGVVVHAWQGGHTVARALAAGAPTLASPQEATYLNHRATGLRTCFAWDPAADGCGVLPAAAAGPRLLLGGSAAQLRRVGLLYPTACSPSLWRWRRNAQRPRALGARTRARPKQGRGPAPVLRGLLRGLPRAALWEVDTPRSNQ